MTVEHIARYPIPVTGKSVFFVAVLGEEGSRLRLWGWYSTFEAAEKAVLENHTDIFEAGYYRFAVIEEIPEGVVAVARNAWWYQASYPDRSHLTFVESLRVAPHIEKVGPPPWSEGVVNFTLP